MRRLTAGCMVTALLVMGAGCDDSSGAGPTTASTTASPTASTTSAGPTSSSAVAGPSAEVRPVLSCTSVEPGASVPTAVAPPSADGTGWVPAGGDQYCLVGPTRATGAIFAGDAAVRLEADQWAVAVSIRPGPDGLDLLNAIAAQCFNHEEACPSGQLAIVVDGAAVSVAAVQTAEFEGTLQISGSLSEAEAQAIARSLNAASLPT